MLPSKSTLHIDIIIIYSMHYQYIILLHRVDTYILEPKTDTKTREIYNFNTVWRLQLQCQCQEYTLYQTLYLYKKAWMLSKSVRGIKLSCVMFCSKILCQSKKLFLDRNKITKSRHSSEVVALGTIILLSSPLLQKWTHNKIENKFNLFQTLFIYFINEGSTFKLHAFFRRKDIDFAEAHVFKKIMIHKV